MFDICVHEIWLSFTKVLIFDICGYSLICLPFLRLHRTASQSFRSKGTCLRSKLNPLGNTDLPCVETGNLLAARACVLCLLCACKMIWWVLEQPASSTLEYLPVFQDMVRLIPSRRLRIHMSHFGGPTKKPTFLYSSGLHAIRV